MMGKRNLILSGLALFTIVAISGCGTSASSLSGKWNVKDVTEHNTGTMTITESKDGSLQGTFQLGAGESANVSGMVDKKGDVSMTVQVNFQTATITGTQNGNTIDATFSHDNQTDNLIITR